MGNSINGKKSYTNPSSTANQPLFILKSSSNVLIAYIRSNEFIHIGITNIITKIVNLLNGEDAKTYASGYASNKHINVAKAATPIEFQSTFCVSASVKSTRS